MNKVYFIAGIRGSGKNTLISKLTQDYPYEFAQALSVKTRKPRSTETLGVDYIKYNKLNFLWEAKILPLINNPIFVEWNQHFGNYYGTRKQEIEGVLRSKKNVLKEIEPEGLEKVFHRPQDFTYQSAFIDIPDESIKERMLRRDINECNKNIELSIYRANKEREKIDNIQSKYGQESIWKLDGTLAPQQVFDSFINQIHNPGVALHS